MTFAIQLRAWMCLNEGGWWSGGGAHSEGRRVHRDQMGCKKTRQCSILLERRVFLHLGGLSRHVYDLQQLRPRSRKGQRRVMWWKRPALQHRRCNNSADEDPSPDSSEVKGRTRQAPVVRAARQTQSAVRRSQFVLDRKHRHYKTKRGGTTSDR